MPFSNLVKPTLFSDKQALNLEVRPPTKYLAG